MPRTGYTPVPDGISLQAWLAQRVDLLGPRARRRQSPATFSQTTTGSGAITLAGMDASGVGSFTATATGSVTLAGIAASGTGEFTATGSGAVTLAGITASGTGAGTATGSGAITLGAIAASGVGTFTATGSGAVTLGAMTAVGTATSLTVTSVGGGVSLGGDVNNGGPSTLIDVFTGATGTDLSIHVPTPGGGSWTSHPSSVTAAVIASSTGPLPNTARGTLGPALYYHSFVPASANYDVVASLLPNAYTTQAVGVAGRLDTTAQTYYGARFNASNGLWELYKSVAGAFSILGSSASLPPTSSRALRLSMSGNAIRVYVDGTTLISALDSSISAVGRAGVWFVGSASEAHSLNLDDFTVTGSPYVEADYRPPATGGMARGGAITAPHRTSITATSGGMRLGGVRTPSRAMSVTPAGGFRIGGSASPLGGHSYTQSPAGGFRLGGVATSRATGASGAAGGQSLGGEVAFGILFTDRASGGFRLGGVVTVTGHHDGIAAAAGGFRLGGSAPPLDATSKPTSGGMRFGGGKIPTDHRIDPSGGLRFGGYKLPTDNLIASLSGGFRFGGSFGGHDILYNIYVNDHEGGPVDYTFPIATVSTLEWDPGPLDFPSDYTWHVRTYDAATRLEEQNIDGRARLVLDADGNNITSMPAAPTGQAAQVLAAGAIMIQWLYRTPSGRAAPSEFRVYGGSPVADLVLPMAVIPFSGDRAYWAKVAGLADGAPYLFAVRAANAVAEEKNTVFVAATADSTGPRQVDDLVLAAV